MNKSWESAKISELVEIRVSNVDKKIYKDELQIRLCNYMDAYVNDYLRNSTSFSVGSVKSNEYSRFKLIKNDVIITKDSETPDDIAVSTVVIEDLDDVICGYHLAILRPDNSKLDGQFLMHKLKIPSVQKSFFRIASGSTRFGLTIGGIQNIKIQFPPLPQQQKIAKILSTCDAVIEKTEAAIAKYKAVKQGLMQDLFTRGINLNSGKLRPKYEEAPELYQKTELGWIPKDWEVKTINEFAGDNNYSIVDGPFGSNLKSIHYRKKGYPIIQSGFVTSNTFKADSYLYVDKDKYYSEIRSSVKAGDIIMAKIGAQCGTCAILPINHPNSIIAGNCLKITVDLKNESRFLLNLLHKYRREGKLDLITSTTAQPAISMASLKQMKIPQPCLDEQKKIVKNIDTLDLKLNKEEQTLNKYHHIKIGLMGDLLEGRNEVEV